MVVQFESLDFLSTENIESSVLDNIFKSSSENIKLENIPTQGSTSFEYIEILKLLNRIQVEKLNEKELKDIYIEGIEKIKKLKKQSNYDLSNLYEKLNILYLVLTKDKEEWDVYKKEKENKMKLSFNHSKVSETKVLMKNKYSSEIEESELDIKKLMKETLNKCNKINELKYFNQEAYAYLTNNLKYDLELTEINHPNSFRTSLSEDDDQFAKVFINSFVKKQLNNLKIKDNDSINTDDDLFSTKRSIIDETLEKATLDQLNKIIKLEPVMCNSKLLIKHYINKLLPEDKDDFKTTSSSFKEIEQFILQKTSSDICYSLHSKIRHIKLEKMIEENIECTKKEFKSYLKKKGGYNYDEECFDSEYFPIKYDKNEIIEHYLTFFFQKKNNPNTSYWKKYADYLSDDMLKKIFVKARITKYPDEVSKLKSLVSEKTLKEIMDLVELYFEKGTNPIQSNIQNPASAVTFNLNLKNIDKLYIKEYEIDTLAFSKEKGVLSDEKLLNFDLSGILPIKENLYTFDKSPVERWKNEFTFNDIPKRCVYIIEFIGKGKICRAIIKNGTLKYVERKTIYGHVINIIDENNEFVKDDNYTVWYGNHAIKPNSDGEFVIMYGEESNSDEIILTDGKFAVSHSFKHCREEYTTDVNFILNSESIVTGNKASLIVRILPKLFNKIPVPCELIEDANLKIHICNIDDIYTEKVFNKIKFNNNIDSSFEFLVPENVKSINVELNGHIKIASRSGNKKCAISYSKFYNFNEVDRTNEIFDLQLKRNDENNTIQLLGKNGEEISNYVIKVQLSHMLLKDPIEYTLQTNEKGMISLGKLPLIRSITCKINDYTKEWQLMTKKIDFPKSIVTTKEKEINIFYPYNLNELKKYPNLWSLYKVANKWSEIGKDYSKNISFVKSENECGIINIKGLESGKYILQIDYPIEHKNIKIYIGEGEKVDKFSKLTVFNEKLLTYQVNTEESETIPLKIEKILKNNNSIDIDFSSNDLSSLRVHAIFSNFVPITSYYSQLDISSHYPIEKKYYVNPKYLYNNDIEMSNEEKYILERKSNKVFIGNMFRKPTTILVPHENKKAEEEIKADAGQDTGFQKKFMMGKRNNQMGACCSGMGMNEICFERNLSDQAKISIKINKSFNYDFLNKPGKIICNLLPDTNGKVSIPFSDEDRLYSNIEIIAIDTITSMSTVLSNNDNKSISSPSEYNNVRMESKFDSTKYYTEKREISTINKDNSLEIMVSSGTKIVTINSLEKILKISNSLNSHNEEIDEFSQIITLWDNYSMNEKCQIYSKHICHELNVYLYFKDNAFFNEIIKPFIQNKLVKSFIDKWLLNENLSESLNDYMKFKELNDFELILLRWSLNDNTDKDNINRLDNLIGKKINLMLKKKKNNSKISKKIFYSIIANGEDMESMNIKDNDDDDDDDDDDNENEESANINIESELNEEESDLNSAVEAETMDFYAMPMAAPQPRVASSSRLRLFRPKMTAKMMVNDSLNKFESMKIKKKETGPEFYEELEKTSEWSETGYWKSSIEKKVSISMNMFWKDVYENTKKAKCVLSKNFGYALISSFTEFMFAMAILDLPVVNNDNSYEILLSKSKYKINTQTNAVIFYKQFVETGYEKMDSILCIRSYFDPEKKLITNEYDDNDNKEKVDPQDFKPGKVYGCEIIVTNVTSKTKYLDVLYQIPNGSIAVNGGKKSAMEQIILTKFNSKSIEFYFYFPTVGKYQHFPVQISHEETSVISSTSLTEITVSHQDMENAQFISWADVASEGSDNDVIEWMKKDSTTLTQLDLVYWRLTSFEFFEKLITFLKLNCEYNETVWSYGLYHNNIEVSMEYLLNNEKYSKMFNFFYINCSNVNIDVMESGKLKMNDYYPLINRRVHKLGNENQTNNQEFAKYYRDFLLYLLHKPQEKYNDRDYILLICCLLIQDRISESMKIFRLFEEKLKDNKICGCNKDGGKIQRDYIASYLDFYNEEYLNQPAKKILKIARERGTKYEKYPITNWQKMFSEIIQSIKKLDTENDGNNENKGKEKEKEEEEEVQIEKTKISIIDRSPTLSAVVANGLIEIKYNNLQKCKICYYPIDIEMQFSIQPFLISENNNSKSNVTFMVPKVTKMVELPSDKDTITLPIDKEYINQNVIVEVFGGNDTLIKCKGIHQPSTITVQVVENFGLLRAFTSNNNSNSNNNNNNNEEDNKKKGMTLVMAPGVYVKIYSKMNDGKVLFWKDGYTDLLGRFDYVSVSSSIEIKDVKKFSALVLLNSSIGVIKEIDPPKI